MYILYTRNNIILWPSCDKGVVNFGDKKKRKPIFETASSYAKRLLGRAGSGRLRRRAEKFSYYFAPRCGRTGHWGRKGFHLTTVVNVEGKNIIAIRAGVITSLAAHNEVFKCNTCFGGGLGETLC